MNIWYQTHRLCSQIMLDAIGSKKCPSFPWSYLLMLQLYLSDMCKAADPMWYKRKFSTRVAREQSKQNNYYKAIKSAHVLENNFTDFQVYLRRIVRVIQITSNYFYYHNKDMILILCVQVGIENEPFPSGPRISTPCIKMCGWIRTGQNSLQINCRPRLIHICKK